MKNPHSFRQKSEKRKKKRAKKAAQNGAKASIIPSNSPMRQKAQIIKPEEDDDERPDLLSVMRMPRSEHANERIVPLEHPPMACNNCPVAAMCPQHKADAACAYEETFEFNLETPDDLARLQMEILRAEVYRLKRAMLLETMQGGIVDEQISNRLDGLFEKLECLRVAAVEEAEGRPKESGGTQILNQFFGDEFKNMFNK